jgi:hypothetical protein
MLDICKGGFYLVVNHPVTSFCSNFEILITIMSMFNNEINFIFIHFRGSRVQNEGPKVEGKGSRRSYCMGKKM